MASISEPYLAAVRIASSWESKPFAPGQRLTKHPGLIDAKETRQAANQAARDIIEAEPDDRQKLQTMYKKNFEDAVATASGSVLGIASPDAKKLNKARNSEFRQILEEARSTPEEVRAKIAADELKVYLLFVDPLPDVLQGVVRDSFFIDHDENLNPVLTFTVDVYEEQTPKELDALYINIIAELKRHLSPFAAKARLAVE